MTHKITSVKPIENFKLLVEFLNGIEKIYDVKSLYAVFSQFRVFEEDKNLFNNVQVDTGGYGISWNDDLDLDAEDIWEYGIEVGKKKIDIIAELAEKLVKARKASGMTQKELAEAVGIHQADISKIERAIANPSLLTLKRLAEGMNMELHISFKPLRKEA